MCDFISLDNIEKVASIAGNFGIFCITAYAFWLSYFSKNIKVTSTGSSNDLFFGSSINCTILNKTLSPLIIEQIIGVYENKYAITIKDFKNNPLVIEPFRSASILGDKYTDLSDKFSTFEDAYFKLITPEKILFIKYRGKIKNKKNTIGVSRLVNYFEHEVLSPSVKYVMTYWYKGTKDVHKIYILDNGFMNQCIKDFNQLPKEILNKPEDMVKFIKKSLNDENWCFVINEIGR